MSVMTVMPRERWDWTVDDLDDVPDDGLQYGLLLVTPAPIVDQQRLTRGVFLLLHAACPGDRFEVFFAPLDWRPDERTSLQPDVLVMWRSPRGTSSTAYLEVGPAVGDQTLELTFPFPVTVQPAQLR